MVFTKHEAKKLAEDLETPTPKPKPKKSSNLTIAELKLIASEEGINLKGITKKADIIELLVGGSREVNPITSKKAPKESDDDSFLKEFTKLNDKREELSERFLSAFSVELGRLPNSMEMSEILGYLSGEKIRVGSTIYRLKERVISDELSCAVYDFYEALSFNI